MNRGPVIVAISLLVLPMLYVGSYLTLVDPRFGSHTYVSYSGVEYYRGYRNGRDWAWRLYYPLEQIDRRVRPEAWKTWYPV